MSYTPARRKEDRFTAKAFSFVQRFFFVIGVAAVISVGLILATFVRAARYVPPGLPDQMVLTYTFRSELAETIDKPSLNQPIFYPQTTFHEIVHALEIAAKDPRVSGFVARIEDPSYSLAQFQEMRDAISHFRAGGKFAWVFAESFGGLGQGMGEYYLASVFDVIWMQPVGSVSVGGISSEVPFLRGLMDKLGVRAEFGHKGRYKAAPETFTRHSMTDEQRANLKSIVGDLYSQMTEGIASTRGMPVEKLKRLVDRSPLSDKAALEEKLVDRLGYSDVMVEEAKKEIGEAGEFIDIGRYAFSSRTENLKSGMPGFVQNYFRKKHVSTETKGRPKIALIYGSGTIMSGSGRVEAMNGIFAGTSVMSARKIQSAFDMALEDEQVAAIVFRIDSPGGAPSASETIRRAVIKAKEKGKPVVVSMGGMAASGGYWVATHADKIVAEPGTLTGSIGVFGGKIVLAGLWDKLGVSWDGVTFGKSAGMWSANRPFTQEEAARFDTVLDDLYKSFRERVAEGRKMTEAQVMAAAEGRVFTGRQAKEQGLVDLLGGLDLAIEEAQKLAAVTPDQNPVVERFPPQLSPMEMFIKMALYGSSMPLFGVHDGAPLQALGAPVEALTLPPEAFLLRLPFTDVSY